MTLLIKNRHNLKCKLGFHDWEILETTDFFHVFYLFDKFLVRKICLSCGKIYDTITPYKTKRLNEYKKAESRQTIAKQLYKQEIK